MDKEKIKIPVKKGDLGLKISDPIEKYINKINKGDKKWEEMPKQLNTLYIFNKNKNPELANKVDKLRNKIASYIELKRKKNPEFSK